MNDYRSKFYQRYVSSHLRSNPPTSLESLKPRESYMVSLIRNHFPPDRDARIIDLGCGHGTLVHFARRVGYRNVTGVDTSPEQVRAAKELGIEGVFEGTVSDVLSVSEDASYDAIVAFDLIEHMNKLELLDFACEVRRVLRPTGRFIIHTPNAGSPFFGRIRYGDYTHEQAFTASSMGQLLLTCGFAKLDCYDDAPVPHGLKSAARLLLWKALRAAMTLYVGIETGSMKENIFTQNFLAVAYVME
jgi:cyclopropane fatty-acyl-phospholipid synthase-like methyltransferase